MNWDWYITGARESQAAFEHFLSKVMGKANALSEFDKVQILMPGGLERSISETAGLVGCSQSTVVSTYAKWKKDGVTNSRRKGVGRTRVIKEEGRRRLGLLVKQYRRKTVDQLTAQCNVGASESVFQHTVQKTQLNMGLRRRRSTLVSLLTNNHRQLRLQLVQQH
ncbi:uncharacterized protein LOC129226752 [Uloborus diversus]|uniref:uncharacterized protein LOC129226752 n=1 Tax=Uloborus diversus TaxID=327109 RepID=UPI002408F29E|nr:uncharacterized protein LOC129226752 [Uloborus diversus]